jgi:hypothetical protein
VNGVAAVITYDTTTQFSLNALSWYLDLQADFMSCFVTLETNAGADAPSIFL